MAAAVVKGCYGLLYAGHFTLMIYSNVHPKWLWRVVNQGPLKEHVDRVALAMLGKPIDLVESGRLPEKRPDEPLMSDPDSAFSSFGSRMRPLAVTYPAEAPFTEDAVKYFLTREIAKLKTNDQLFGRILNIVVAIAVTILLHSSLPIASYLIGAAAGTASHILFHVWNRPRIEAVTEHYSTPQEIEAGKRYL